MFETASYQGVLGDFSGRRWWRAGVDAILWDLTSGQSSDARAVQALISAQVDNAVFTDLLDPVLTLDEDLAVVPELASATNSVRILPDDWPSYADQPWGAIETVRQSA